MGDGTNQPANWLRKVLGLSHLIRYEFENSLLKTTWGSLHGAVAGSLAAVVFAIAVLMLSVMAVVGPEQVFQAQAATTSEVVSEEKVEYYLPYPGLLPDSSLYRVKALRDWVRLNIFTWKQERKAELELLYADKRINAADVLIAGGKADLGAVTALKAENYLRSASDRLVKLTAKKVDVKSQLSEMAKAASKHKQLLEEMKGPIMGTGRELMDKATVENETAIQQIGQALREAK